MQLNEDKQSFNEKPITSMLPSDPEIG